MRLAKPRHRYADEQRIRAQGRDRGTAHVSHATAQPTHHLEQHVADGALVRDASFDPLGDELSRRELALLAVAISAPILHRRTTAHAPHHLESATADTE